MVDCPLDLKYEIGLLRIADLQILEKKHVHVPSDVANSSSLFV